VSDYKISVTLAGHDDASDEINKVNRELNQLGQVSGTSAGQVNVLGGAMSALGAAVSIGAFVDITTQLNALGIQARAAETTFGTLAQEIGGMESSLAGLQAATGKVVDDMTLMDGANKLMITGFASSQDELEKYISGAVRLGGAMGIDAKGAIENFGAALRNQSYDRLDELGVSGSTVRARIEELKESGMGFAEAFNTAVIEQMDISLARLGDSAQQSETSFARLSTRLQNVTQDVAQFVAQGLEAGAMVIEIGIAYVEQGQAEAELAAMVESTATRYAQEFMGTFTGELDVSQVQVAVEVALADNGDGIRRNLDDIFESAGIDYLSAAEQSQLQLAYDYAMRRAQAEATAQAAREELDARRQQQEIFMQNRQAMADMAEEAERQEAANALNAESMQLMASLTDYISEQFITLNGIEIIPSEAAESAREMADRMAEIVDLAESFGIDTSDLSEAARQAEAIAQQAERAKDAFDNMSLDALLGAGDGGRMAEFSNMLLQDMQEQGRSDEDIAASRQALMLGTGQATGGTIAIEGLSELLVGLSPEEQTKATLNLDATMNRLAEEGISLSDLSLEQAQAFAGVTGTGAETVLVQAGDTLSGIAASLDMTVAELAALNDIEDPSRIFAGQELITGEGLSVGEVDPEAIEEIKQSLIDSNTEVATMNETLGAVVAPDLGPETLQLMASYETAIGISKVMSDLTSREHRIKVVYEVSTVGGAAPSGAPGLPTAVPVSSSQVSRR